MKEAPLWTVLQRSWRAVMAPRRTETPVRLQTTSAEAMLLDAALQALSSDDLPSLLQSICHQLRVYSGSECTSIVLVDPDRGEGACLVAAGDGWPHTVVGMRIDLPLHPDGGRALPHSDKRPISAAWVEPPLYRRHGLSGGLWAPIEHDCRTVGWITAHTRDTHVLDSASESAATALARIVGDALHRDRTVRDLRRQAVQSRALCRQLPVLWMSIDTRAGTLLDCNAAIGSWLGHTAIDCIGKPAVDFFETADAAATLAALCRPMTTGADVGVPFRLKHRSGNVLDCVSSGALLGDEGAGLPGPMRVLWVFHERQALLWGAPRSGHNHDGADPLNFDWTMECDRERRQQSLRLLSLLRHGLHGLRSIFNMAATDVLEPIQMSQGVAERVRAIVDQTWQASEKAAVAIASPDERVTDLLSALQRLAGDLSESTPSRCVLQCSGPVAHLSAAARLAAFRTTRELLLQMLHESNVGRIALQVDTTAKGFIRLRLVRQPEGDGHQVKARLLMSPAPRGTLGLFGAKTMLAGVGGALTISPGQHGTIFAEFQIPVAGPVVTGDIVRANG
jgi:PAS domain-containing protein